MRTLLQDLRFGFRTLVRRPGFALVAVLGLALGIGANTAIFSVVDAVLLRPLPYPDAERLVWIEGVNPPRGITQSSVSAPDFDDWRKQADAFEAMAAFAVGGANLVGEGEPERVPSAWVGEGFFRLLGVEAAVGRTFLAEEERPDAEQVVVISHGLWQRRFGSDPKAVGSRVSVGGKSSLIVGVMPPGYDYPQQSQLWRPLQLEPAKQPRDNRNLQAVGRLKPGVPLAQAQAQLDALTRRQSEAYAVTNAGWAAKLTVLQEQLVGNVRPGLLLLLAAVGLVLLITCANVANLMLARAAARRKEIGVRTALGASRWRIVRQLLTESLLLSFAGGAAGLLLSVWLVELFTALNPVNTQGRIGLDARALLFTLGVTCLVGLLFGLAPALQASKSDLNETLKESGRGATEGWKRLRLRRALIVLEVALSLVLLAGAGLLVKSFVLLREVEPGFDPGGVLTMRVSLPSAKYKEPARKAEFFRRLTERVKALPGAEGAGAVNFLPLGGSNLFVGRSYVLEGRPLVPEEARDAAYHVATPGYFDAMRVPVVRGRAFDERDGEDAPRVVIVNETAARLSFPGEDPLGKRITVWRDEKFYREIVGVVGDVKTGSLEDETGPQVYVPHAQDAEWGGMSLAVRTSGEPEALARAVRAEVLALDREQPVFDVKTMGDVLAASVADRRASTLLLSVFAGAALLLAGLGVYGVISYSVTQRTHEIGLRMALGARGSDVLRMVLRQGMLLAFAGVIVGLAGAFALTRLLAGLLFGVSAADPTVYASVSALLLLVALLACYVPARRATKVDPMVALRYE